MPYFKAMHEMTPDHVHEEIQLLALALSTMLLETQWHVPSYRAGIRPLIRRPLMRIYAGFCRRCSGFAVVSAGC
jgi:hypothetical protein